MLGKANESTHRHFWIHITDQLHSVLLCVIHNHTADMVSESELERLSQHTENEQWRSNAYHRAACTSARKLKSICSITSLFCSIFVKSKMSLMTTAEKRSKA